MSLVELLSRKNIVNRRCILGRVIDQLPSDEREALENALKDETLKSSFIHNALLQEGYALAGSSVGVHRRGRCRCNVSG